MTPDQRAAQNRHSVFCVHPLRSDTLWVIAHEHVGEMGTVMDAFIHSTVLWQRLNDGGEIGFVEVGKGVALASIQADFVGRRWKEVVGHVLHHIP
jgi:hypothetical protein